MKPSAFEYFVPAGLEEAVGLLEQHGEEARPLAGGQSLLPLMKLRLARPGYLVDLRRVAGLSGIREEAGGIALGALVRHRQVETSESVRSRCPLLSEAAALIGNPQVRNRGTLGGSLCHADPAAEFPAAVLAVQADGAEILTVEGLAREGGLYPLQEAFWENHASNAATARRGC